MMRFLSLVLLLVSISFTLALCQSDADGCGSVGRRGDYIRIAEESALIVWDPVKKVEHFIRRAAFDTKSPDFGFLVPTPTQPTLAEVKDRVFGDMDRWILPRTVEQTRFKFEPISCCMMFGTKSASMRVGAKGDVRILAEQQVGGFNTTILEADNTESLTEWITEHGYSSDPELESWLAPYVAAKWKITAFKIMQDPTTGQLATTKPVRMSFATDRPFFPYREPAVKDDKQNHRARLLRVFFVSDSRMEGKLGNNTAWPATVPWSDQLDEDQRKEVAKQTGIAEADLPASAWMTTFEDHASPRPGKDEVYFDPAQDRTPIRPPPFIKYDVIWIPFDVALVGVVFLSLLGWATYRSLPRSKA